MKKNKDFPADRSLRDDYIKKKIEGYALIDDAFFRIVMKDNVEAAEAIVRVALNMPDVKIESVKPQYSTHFLDNRGVCFDLRARRSNGDAFDIEMQKGEKGELPRRSRYYLSSLTIDSVNEGTKFADIPDAYVLFVCREDPFGEGEPVYPYSTWRDNKPDRALKDGGHIVFFNCAYKGENEYGRLASDLTEANYKQIGDPVLKQTVLDGKIGARKEEVRIGIRKEIYDTAYESGLKRGKAEAVLALLRDGRIPPEAIAEILSVPLDEVLAIKEKGLN